MAKKAQGRGTKLDGDALVARRLAVWTKLRADIRDAECDQEGAWDEDELMSRWAVVFIAWDGDDPERMIVLCGDWDEMAKRESEVSEYGWEPAFAVDLDDGSVLSPGRTWTPDASSNYALAR
jgi:hypothetical protein